MKVYDSHSYLVSNRATLLVWIHLFNIHKAFLTSSLPLKSPTLIFHFLVRNRIRKTLCYYRKIGGGLAKTVHYHLFDKNEILKTT